MSQRVQEYAPRLEKALAASKATISTADAIDAPLHQAAFDIINNPAMTDAEKDAAINQLGALQKSLKQGFGDSISPLQLNKLKQAIGNRVNWGGNVSVTDEVKPAYRALYSTMKNLISKSVPEAKELNERLSNLLSAQSDLETLMKAEEVGRGGGVASGKIGSTVIGMAEREAGRVLPGAAKIAKSPAARGATAGAASGVVDGNDHPQGQVPIAQDQNTDDWIRFRASDGKTYLSDPQRSVVFGSPPVRWQLGNNPESLRLSGQVLVNAVTGHVALRNDFRMKCSPRCHSAANARIRRQGHGVAARQSGSGRRSTA